MKIVKELNPIYTIENFGVVAVDEECSYIKEDDYFAVCEIVSMPESIKYESTAYFFFDIISDIEKELKLMPNALRLALFEYMLNNKLEFEWDWDD